MSDLNLHLEAEQLEAYLEGGLDDGRNAVVESHLVGCERCRSELEEWRALFAALESLPAIEPTVGFADRVMAGVSVQPTPARVAAAARWLPRSTKGLSLVAACMALPVLGLGAVAAWVLSQPWATSVTAEGVLLYAWSGANSGLDWVAAQVRALLLSTGVAGVAGDALGELVAVAGPAGLGLAAAAFCLAAIGSIWVLYHNLVRYSTRESRYAPYTI